MSDDESNNDLQALPAPAAPPPGRGPFPIPQINMTATPPAPLSFYDYMKAYQGEIPEESMPYIGRIKYNRETGHYDRLDPDKRLERFKKRRKANADILDSFKDMVLRHKKEIVKVPSAVSLAGAERYAQRMGKGYRAAEEDINKDDGLNIKEIVVFDPDGNPYVINGYKLKNSDYPYRRAYQEKYERGLDKEGKKRKSYKDFVRETYGAPVRYVDNAFDSFDFSRDKIPAAFQPVYDNFVDLNSKGWRMPVKPRKNLSLTNIFGQFWSYGMTFLKTQGKATGSAKLLSKLVSPLLLSQLGFLILFDMKCAVAMGCHGISYEEYKALMKQQGEAYKDKFREIFYQNGAGAIPAATMGNMILQSILGYQPDKTRTVYEILTVGNSGFVSMLSTGDFVVPEFQRNGINFYRENPTTIASNSATYRYFMSIIKDENNQAIKNAIQLLKDNWSVLIP